MSRCYADRVEVLRRNDQPAHFLWRSRLYVVRGVLAHWVEAGEWWRADVADGAAESPPRPASAAARERTVATAGAATTRAATTRAGTAVETAGPAERVAESPPAGDLPDEEREVWRVEASCGRGGVPGVYDLCFAWSSGAWTLVRTTD
jgi:hypothetical protein